MGGVSPETCLASYKHEIINFDTLLHLVAYFCMNYVMMHGSTTHLFFFFVFIFLLPRCSWSRYTCINTAGPTEQIINPFLNMAFCFMLWERGINP